MKQTACIAILICLIFSGFSQEHLNIIVRDKSTTELLQGVDVAVKSNTGIRSITDAGGTVKLQNLPAGTVTVILSYVGYKTRELSVIIPDTSLHTVLLEQDEAALKNVTVIAATRGNDRIENAATKVEVLGQEEMNEESTLKPGNIASILGDVSGVQIQQSSAITGNANVRIQGLDGKYTQILRDGMPLFEGYSGNFGILSVPPLDLRQIELIKGAASTLYGGGAIAGLINLVSKKPFFSPDASFLINQTDLKETNINAYYAQRWKYAGFTFFGGQNFQKQVDINKDGFSDLPNTKSTLIHPIFFIYPNNKNYISLGWSGNLDERLGGDMIAIKDQHDTAHPYFGKNRLARNTFTLIAEDHLNSVLTLTIKGSLSLFKRDETTNTYFFSAQQNNFYNEVSLVAHANKHNIVVGLNFSGDRFSPSSATPVPVGEFSDKTAGVFVQDTWQVLEKTKIETGLRIDHHSTYGTFILPRIAVFHHFSRSWGTRLGFGMGYATPDPLAPQIKDYSIYNIQPITSGMVAEKSIGANIEFNYKKTFGENNSVFINQAFFITNINDPITANEDISGRVSFSNQPKPVITKGFDTYAQITLDRWEFYLGYTYTDAERKYLTQNQFMLLTPRNRAASVIVYEIDGRWRFGLESSYNGYQYREDYSKTPGYLFIAAMIEKKFGPRWSLVLNCENLSDERQSKYESLYTGSVTNPVFKPLWAPIDGRVINLCLRFQPFAD